MLQIRGVGRSLLISIGIRMSKAPFTEDLKLTYSRRTKRRTEFRIRRHDWAN